VQRRHHQLQTGKWIARWQQVACWDIGGGGNRCRHAASGDSRLLQQAGDYGAKETTINRHQQPQPQQAIAVEWIGGGSMVQASIAGQLPLHCRTVGVMQGRY